MVFLSEWWSSLIDFKQVVGHSRFSDPLQGANLFLFGGILGLRQDFERRRESFQRGTIILVTENMLLLVMVYLP